MKCKVGMVVVGIVLKCHFNFQDFKGFFKKDISKLFPNPNPAHQQGSKKNFTKRYPATRGNTASFANRQSCPCRAVVRAVLSCILKSGLYNCTICVLFIPVLSSAGLWQNVSIGCSLAGSSSAEPIYRGLNRVYHYK
ncbi:hypothetical protein OUZ56_028883 [Daphnia magna]|uniref:Uncharacterized protein n=1 Tax=Daphnia magna TaxID=35525 RepID=A0ABR0B578_9CRUS|nr:hypothetical protein OUZ56_028883 [Daphnia magna]